MYGARTHLGIYQYDIYHDDENVGDDEDGDNEDDSDDHGDDNDDGVDNGDDDKNGMDCTYGIWRYKVLKSIDSYLSLYV